MSKSSNSPLCIGKYKILSNIGHGQYGEVFSVSYNNSIFAIKKLSVRDVVHVYNEVSMYSILQHAYISRPIEFITSNDSINIVMPLYDGTLYDKIYKSNSGLTESTIKQYMFQLLSAMDYIHDNKIIYRDLKPSNIAIQGTEIRIIDFGLAHFLHDNLDPMMTTKGYIAPEAISYLDDELQTKDLSTYTDPIYGKYKGVNTSIDIWAVGIIIMECLTGTNPFLTRQDIIESKIHDYIDKLKCSAECKDLLKHILVFDPIDRYTAKQCLSHKWLSQFTYVEPNTIDLPHHKYQSNNYARISNFLYAKTNNKYMVEYIITLYDMIYSKNPLMDTKYGVYIMSILLHIGKFVYDEVNYRPIYVDPDRYKDIIWILRQLDYNIYVK